MAGEFISQLIAAGDVAGLWDAHSGNFVDFSGTGNDGTIQAAASWEGFGIRRADGAIGAVNVTDHVSIQLATFTVVGVFDRLNLAPGLHQYIFYKNNQFALSVHANGRIYLNDWLVNRFSAVVVTEQKKYFAVSVTGGGIGQAYMDGLDVGPLGGASTVTASASDLQLGGTNSTLRHGLLINRVLTASEHAQLYQELAELQFPTSFWSFAKYPQDVFKRDPKLISGWNLLPTGGQVPDEITTRDLTTIHQMVHKPGILGQGMSGPIAGYLASGNDPYVHADFVNGYSVECWCRLAAIPAAAQAIQSTVGRMYLSTNSGTLQFLVYDSTAAFQTASSAGGAMRAEELFHVIGTAKENGDVLLYVDGVLQPVADTMVNWNFAAIGRPMVWGAQWTLTVGAGADFFEPRIYDYELSQEEVTTKYLEGARAIQFQTDWGFKQSPAAEGGTIHQELGGTGSPLRAGDAVGRFKIETDTVDGQLCKVLRCTVAGKVYTNSELWFDCSPTEAAFGTFSGWMYKADASTLTWKFIGTDLNAAANGYAVVWAADESVVISELGVGNVIAGGSASHSTWHKFDQTRASDGDFDGYIDETTFGNGNDLTITDSIGMLWSMGVGDMISLSNVAGGDGQIKRLGVDPPL